MWTVHYNFFLYDSFYMSLKVLNLFRSLMKLFKCFIGLQFERMFSVLDCYEPASFINASKWLFLVWYSLQCNLLLFHQRLWRQHYWYNQSKRQLNQHHTSWWQQSLLRNLNQWSFWKQQHRSHWDRGQPWLHYRKQCLCSQELKRTAHLPCLDRFEWVLFFLDALRKLRWCT